MEGASAVVGETITEESNGVVAMDAVSHSSSSVSGLSSIVSAVVKRNQDEAFLLRDYEGKGLWLPCTEVKNGETCVTAAQRLGFEVIMIVISLYT